MTPQQIIDRAKARFDVLYFDNAGKLQALMQDSMGKFEDRAGAVRSFQIAAGTVGSAPEDFLSVATVFDANGLFVDHTVSGLTVTISTPTKYPVTVSYLVNFRDMALDDDLPPGSVGLISEHFEAQLAIQNARRERNVVMAAGLQREIPVEETLTARLDAVETAMEENAEIIPMATVA